MGRKYTTVKVGRRLPTPIPCFVINSKKVYTLESDEDSMLLRFVGQKSISHAKRIEVKLKTMQVNGKDVKKILSVREIFNGGYHVDLEKVFGFIET